ncbi:MAG: S9 family peptidase [bacterium]|jgi:dipeptidyl aminopeptidase/acylaminoacyl peptidase
MSKSVLFFTATLMLFAVATLQAQSSARVEALLKEVDTWVTSDTNKIMAFIDSTNAVTAQMLESSPYWEATLRDLSFLLGIDLISSPQVDNTGRLYFQMRLTGESEALFYIDRPMGWPIQITPNGWADEGLTISYYAVHPSGDFILVGVNKHGDEMHDIWRFTRDGKFKPLLEDRRVRFTGVIFDEDNPDRFYLNIDNRKEMRIGRYTISTGRLDTLYTEPGAFYPTDYYKGKITFVRWFSFSQGQLAIFDVATGKVTDLSDTSLFWAAGFTADGKVLTLTSAMSSEDEFMKFCLVDPAKPKKFSQVYDPKRHTDEFSFIRKTGTIIASLNKDGYSELVGFDLSGKPVTVPVSEIGVISDLSGNEVGDFVFGFSSPKVAPTAFKFRAGDSKLENLGKVSTFGYNFADTRVEVIRYKSADGTLIPSLIYFPANIKKDGNNPAIVSYHGGPPSQSRPHFQRNIAFALSKGFIMMFPNVRGSTGYGPAYERADNMEGRLVALKDAEAAIDYLISEGYSRPEKIAIWGGSYGGYTVNWLGTQCPEKFACIVSEVGVSDPKHTVMNSSQVFMRGWEKEYGPMESELVRKISPIFYAENLSKPIYLTGGYNDPRVPPSDPRRFAYVLSKLGKPVWYFEDREQGHGGNMKAQIVRDLASSYVFTMMHVM